MAVPESPERVRFRDFELDLAAYELRRNGHRVRLERPCAKQGWRTGI